MITTIANIIYKNFLGITIKVTLPIIAPKIVNIDKLKPNLKLISFFIEYLTLEIILLNSIANKLAGIAVSIGNPKFVKVGTTIIPPPIPKIEPIKPAIKDAKIMIKVVIKSIMDELWLKIYFNFVLKYKRNGFIHFVFSNFRIF